MVNYSSCYTNLWGRSYVFRSYQKRNNYSRFWNSHCGCYAYFDPSSLQLDSNYWLFTLADMGCLQSLQKIESKTTANDSVIKRKFLSHILYYFHLLIGLMRGRVVFSSQVHLPLGFTFQMLLTTRKLKRNFKR